MTHEEYIQRLKDSPFQDKTIQVMFECIDIHPDLISDSINVGKLITQNVNGDTMEYVSDIVQRFEKINGVLGLTLMFLGTSQEIWDNYLVYGALRSLGITEKNGITFVDATE
jgi:tRNA splicing endonuclease